MWGDRGEGRDRDRQTGNGGGNKWKGRGWRQISTEGSKIGRWRNTESGDSQTRGLRSGMVGTQRDLWATLGTSPCLVLSDSVSLSLPGCFTSPPAPTPCSGQKTKPSLREGKGEVCRMLGMDARSRALPPHPSGSPPAAISRHSLLCQAEVLGNDPDSPGPALQGRRTSRPQTVPTQGQGWGAQKEHLPCPGGQGGLLQKALAGKGQETGLEFGICDPQTWVQILRDIYSM